MPTPASKPATGSCWPTPRMKAVRVELVPREASSVTFGVVVPMSRMSREPEASSCAPVKAVTEIGTLSRFSARLRAVTTISLLFWSAAAASPLATSLLEPGCACSAGVPAGGGAAFWARSGVGPANAASAVPMQSAAMWRVWVRFIVSLPDSGHGVGWRAMPRQTGGEIAERAVEKLGLLEMRGMAGPRERDGARIRQRMDEMVGGASAVEVALGAMDDERRLQDVAEHGPEILADQRRPERADGGPVGPRELLAGPDREREALRIQRLGEDGRPRRRGERAEIFRDGAAAGLAHGAREAELPVPLVHHARRHVDDDGAGEAPGGGAGEYAPEYRGAQRPADSDRILDLEMLKDPLDIIGEQLEIGRRACAGISMPPQVDADEPEAVGERPLPLEEAAMRHEAVEQQDRPAGALVLVGNLRSVACGIAAQDPPPRPCTGRHGSNCRTMKVESIFNFESIHNFL